MVILTSFFHMDMPIISYIADKGSLNSKVKTVEGLAKLRIKGENVLASMKRIQQLVGLFGNTESLESFEMVGMEGRVKIQIDKYQPEFMSGSLDVIIIKIRHYVQLNMSNELSKVKLDMYINERNQIFTRVMFKGKFPQDNTWKLKEVKGVLCINDENDPRCGKVHFCSTSFCNTPTA